MKVMLMGLASAMAFLGAGAAQSSPLELIFSADFELGTAGSWSGGVGTHDILEVTLPGDVPLIMVRIPAGTYMMGSPGYPGCVHDPAQPELCERSRGLSETLHEVTLTHDYYLGKYEVTQGQWEAVMGTPMPSSCGSYGVGPSFPAYCVSWDEIAGGNEARGATDSQGFLARLNQHLADTGQPGAGLFRLPTEAEWERGARAVTQTRFSHGDVLECTDICGPCDAHTLYMVWCGTPGAVSEVGTKQANGLGLHNIHGNLREWVQDWSGAYPTGPVSNPTGPAGGLFRVIRGTSYVGESGNGRSAARGYNDPLTSSFFDGFRLAASLPAPD